MSLDATYILVYWNLNYVQPSPMAIDFSYLSKKYGGKFTRITQTDIYWDKPKYTLHPDEFKNLKADQILEKKDCDLWEIVK